MSAFTFDNGQWLPLFPLPEILGNEEHSDYLARIGYDSIKLLIGHQHGSSIEIYETKNNESFYVIVTPVISNCYDIYIPNFPSLMMFIKDYAPAFSQITIQQTLEELTTLSEKFFKLNYGSR